MPVISSVPESVWAPNGTIAFPLQDFSRHGRVNHMLRRRLELLVKVERLGKTLDVTADVGERRLSCSEAI